MTDRALYQLMRYQYGVQSAGGHRTIEAEALSAEDAGYLDVPPGFPRCGSRARHGRPTGSSSSFFR